MNSETLADIVAEMRNCQLASVTKVEKYNKDQCFGCDSHPACAEVAEFADRLEAAAERERDPLAKPRLCKSCKHFLPEGCEICGCSDYVKEEGGAE